MAFDAVAALTGPAAGALAQTTQDESPKGTGKSSDDLRGFPSQMSQVPAWGMGQALGEVLADKFMANDPAAFEGKEDELKQALKSIMTEVTKSLGKSTDYLKELDDDEEKCAATQIYNS